MKLTEILEKVNNFDTNEETEEYEITEFFDKIGDDFAKLGKLSVKEKDVVIQTFFDFLNRQSSALNEDWSFIHLIESIDEPRFEIYNEKLITYNKKNPNLTSLVLLVRHINTLEGKEWEDALILLKEISEKNELSDLVKDEAKEYYNDQLERE